MEQKYVVLFRTEDDHCYDISYPTSHKVAVEGLDMMKKHLYHMYNFRMFQQVMRNTSRKWTDWDTFCCANIWSGKLLILPAKE